MWQPDALCDGHLASARAQWLVNHRGLVWDSAQAQVMAEFPRSFDTTAGGNWSDALVCDGHLASARAQWLVDNKATTLEQARQQVMREFPEVFGSRGASEPVADGVVALGGASATRPKSSTASRGTMPSCCGLPIMECDLPEPVWP